MYANIYIYTYIYICICICICIYIYTENLQYLNWCRALSINRVLGSYPFPEMACRKFSDDLGNRKVNGIPSPRSPFISPTGKALLDNLPRGS